MKNPHAILASNEEWNAWGTRDPMYGVATWPGRKRGGESPWRTEEFYAMGAKDWEDYRTIWNRVSAPDLTGRVLEIGAGAGRISQALAGDFAEVTAVDVASGMLDFARAHVFAENIAWTLGDGMSLPANDKSVQAVFSVHVFQHFDSAQAIWANLKECARVLSPGGTTFLHIPMHTFPEANPLFSRLARSAYAAYEKAARIKANYRRRAMRGRSSEPYMHGVSVERDVLLRAADDAGFVDCVVVDVRTRESRYATSILIARRA